MRGRPWQKPAAPEGSEIGDVWREIRRERQDKRARNRETSAELLADARIPFTEHNGGSHLIVGSPAAFDFWPGTGKWIRRSDKTKGRGVFDLLRSIGGPRG